LKREIEFSWNLPYRLPNHIAISHKVKPQGFGIRIAGFNGMERGTVVLVGNLTVEPMALDFLVLEFGWTFKTVDNLTLLRELSATDNVVSVLFSPKDLNLTWDRALRCILASAPGALPILCHGFAETIDWPQAAEAGAFHSLLLPFDLPEVRQSLGFVRSAKAGAESGLLQSPARA
jgi:hypothetical protein